MKIEKKARAGDNKEEFNDLISLKHSRDIVFGLTSYVRTLHGLLATSVDVEDAPACCYLCINPAKVNHRSPYYSRDDVYMLRDCLFDLTGGGELSMTYGSINENDPFSSTVMSVERDGRKDKRRWLSEKLSERLEQRGYCLLDNANFGVLLAKKVGAHDEEAATV